MPSLLCSPISPYLAGQLLRWRAARSFRRIISQPRSSAVATRAVHLIDRSPTLSTRAPCLWRLAAVACAPLPSCGCGWSFFFFLVVGARTLLLASWTWTWTGRWCTLSLPLPIPRVQPPPHHTTPRVQVQVCCAGLLASLSSSSVWRRGGESEVEICHQSALENSSRLVYGHLPVHGSTSSSSTAAG